MRTSTTRHAHRLLRGRLTALLSVLGLVLGLGLAVAPVQAAGGGTGASTPGGPTAAGGRWDSAGETHRITLLTGDVVVLHVAAGGEQSAWVAKAAPGARVAPQIYEQDGQVHVVPAEAAPYVASGAIDPNLFNVSLLVQQGFSDDASNDLPLLVQAHGGPSAARAPAVPTGTRKVRELDSIATVAVDAPKSRMRSVWLSLRGSRAAAPDATNARLAAAGTVWLNGLAHTTALADSAPPIAAAAAGAGGFDGSGVDVAVLDTGYDPTHPDLAGRVTKEHNFTSDPDPAGEIAVDDNGHGTHVASTIAGSGAASDGRYVGVAPGADLWIGKVLDSQGNGSIGQIIAGMQWAADSGADVVNMSLGTPWVSDGTDPLSEALDQLTESTGALFVVAAGNSGPAEQTVTAPGSADLALTVGAVDDQDRAASFSSRGPRWGDLAIKPEIVAPGVDIVAARAAGTSLGNLLGKYYTSMSGTSMATPHVAGAAAILAEEHPAWTAAELKARLVATSHTLDEPVSFQGAGRVDVAAAVRDTVTVDDAALSLGRVPQTSGPITRTLTYANPTDHDLRLRLSTQVSPTGVDQHHKPELGFDKSLVVVPADGTVHVQVTLDPQATASGRYAGDLVAHVVGQPDTQVHSVISFAVQGPLRNVTVNAVGRDGKPAVTGSVDLWNESTGQLDRVWIDHGTVTTQVPDGTYTLMTTIEDSRFLPVNQTVAGDPELKVDGDVTLSFDARDAAPLEVRTPRKADLDLFRVMWSRRVDGHSLTSTSAEGEGGSHVYVLPSKKARRGTFEFESQVQLLQPMLELRVGGPNGADITPNPRFASLDDPFVGERTLPVVDAGEGTTEDFSKVDAAGKIALVTRSGSAIWSQVQAAKSEGVALLLVLDDRPGAWSPTVLDQGLPSYVLSQEAGADLRQALAQDPDLTLAVHGLQDPTYSYELAFPEPRLPRKPTYDVSRSDIATVVSDYRQNSARMGTVESWIPRVGPTGFGNSMPIWRNGPVVRTQYVSATPGVRWERFGQPGAFADAYWTWSTVRQYRPGERAHQVWWGPLVHPAVLPLSGAENAGAPVARFHDAIRIVMPHYSYGGSVYGFIQNQLGDTSELTLRRDGEVIGKSGWSVAQFPVPAERATYELTLKVDDGEGNFADTSVRTESTWRFESARSSAARTVLPLVQPRYDLDTDGYNRVPAGSSYPLFITPGYQPGASGPGGFRASVEVSYDGGDTWLPAPVDQAGDRLRATVPAAPGPGYASVRVEVTDSAGNALTQEIDRAWKVAPEEAQEGAPEGAAKSAR